MGNSQKKAQDYSVINSFEKEEWLNKDLLPYCELWENKNTHLLCEAYPIPAVLDFQELDNYEIRKSHDHDIVKVHHIAVQKNKNLCSGADRAHALVERIPYRLQNIQDLSEMEALTVLRSVYRGYNTIGSFYGPIEPYEDMICFNESGKPKVWLNSNLGKNKPQAGRQQNPIDSPMSRNEVYVRKIFNMVESRTLRRELPYQLKNKFRQSNPNNFFEALNNVEQYSESKNFEIPEQIKPRMYNSVKASSIFDKQIPQQDNTQAIPVKTQPIVTNQKMVQSITVQQPIQRYNSGNFGESIPQRQPPKPVMKNIPPQSMSRRSQIISVTPKKQSPHIPYSAFPRGNSPFTMTIPPPKPYSSDFRQVQPQNIPPPPPPPVVQNSPKHIQVVESKKVIQPQPMIFSFNDKNFQPHQSEVVHHEQINIPRYSVIESQQGGSPINQSPNRQQQSNKIYTTTQFDEPEKVQINQPIIQSSSKKMNSSEEKESIEDKEHEQHEYRFKQFSSNEELQAEMEIIQNREVESAEDDNVEVEEQREALRNDFLCDEEIDEVEREELQIRQGESFEEQENEEEIQNYGNEDRNLKVVYYMDEAEQENVQFYEKKQTSVHEDEDEFYPQQSHEPENIFQDENREQERQESSDEKLYGEGEPESEGQKQQQELAEEGYNFKYRQSQVEQYNFNEKNYPQVIGIKEVQSHHSIEKKQPVEEIYDQIGMKKAVSIVTREVKSNQAEDRIPNDASYERIQEYIKKKFKDYIHGSQSRYHESRNVQEMASYVENKYNKLKKSEHDVRPELPTFTPMEKNIDFEEEEGNAEESSNERQLDALDVKMMERSLDKKYNSIRMQKEPIKGKEEEGINVQQLEENLIRFEESRVGNKFAVSEVSKIGSLDERINSLHGKQTYDYRNYEPKTYEYKSYESEYKYSQPSGSYSRFSKKNKKVSNYLSSIDEKYDKYVTSGVKSSIKGSQASRYYDRSSRQEIPYTGKSSSNYQYEDYTQWNRQNQENIRSSSRMQTGKFNHTSHESGFKGSYEPKSSLTYDDLRKFLWS